MVGIPAIIFVLVASYKVYKKNYGKKEKNVQKKIDLNNLPSDFNIFIF